MNKNILALVAAALVVSTSMTSCIEEYEPSKGYASGDQVTQAPTAYESLVSGLTSTLAGTFIYSDDNHDADDFGYPAMMIKHDIMGQDMTPIDASGNEWFAPQYSASVALGPQYAACQMPWTYYYGWIKSCNNVLKSYGGENVSENHYTGVGIAYALRAMYYLDLVRTYGAETYAKNKQAETVPMVTEVDAADMTKNPRMTNEAAFAFILSDLDQAEKYLADYQRSDKTTPDLSVVYGLKARAYLTMEDWPNAEKYAKLAMAGYSVMTGAQYTDYETGFNTPNDAWMFCVQYKATDDNIKLNDGDSSWGSKMITESGMLDNPGASCGYAANYGKPLFIDRHLYETIPATDCRKKCFVDFSADDATSEEELYSILSANTQNPELLAMNKPKFGGLEVKFRSTGGSQGRYDKYVGFCVAVPLMRVEEMKLIEAEAVGMQSGRQAEGISLLTAFAKQRDASYEYGKHNEAYGNSATSAFQNEIWWQRRVEFWGEGLSMYDIKRLQKGIIRSYEGTNHVDGYQWNTTTTPNWMNWCITNGECNYNTSCTNNPTPSAPSGNSQKFVW